MRPRHRCRGNQPSPKSATSVAFKRSVRELPKSMRRTGQLDYARMEHVGKPPICQRSGECERCPGIAPASQRSHHPAALDHDRLAAHGVEILAQAYHPRGYAVSRSQIERQHMVIRVMQDAVQKGQKLGMSSGAEATLKDRKLKPLTVAFHDPKDPSPPLRVSDVVGHDVQMLVVHDQRVVKLGYSCSSPSRCRARSRACSSSSRR